MTIKPGDVVLLKSGGPPMTVVSIDESEISCVWIGEEGQLFRETLPTIALELIESDLEKDEDDDIIEQDDDDDDEEDDDDDDDDEEDEDDDDDDDDDKIAKDDRRRAGRK